MSYLFPGERNAHTEALAQQFIKDSLVGVNLGAESTLEHEVRQFGHTFGKVLHGTQQQLALQQTLGETLAGAVVPQVAKAHSVIHELAAVSKHLEPHELFLVARALPQYVQMQAIDFQLPETTNYGDTLPLISLRVLPRFLHPNGTKGQVYLAHPMDVGFNLTPVIDPDQAFGFSLPILYHTVALRPDEFTAMPEEAADGYAERVMDCWDRFTKKADEAQGSEEPVILRALGIIPLPPEEHASHHLSFDFDAVPYMHRPQTLAWRAHLRTGIDGLHYSTCLLSKDHPGPIDSYARFYPLDDAPKPLFVCKEDTKDASITDSNKALLGRCGLTERSLRMPSQGAVAFCIGGHVTAHQRFILPKHQYPDAANPAPRLSIVRDVPPVPRSSYMDPFDKWEPYHNGRPVIVSLRLSSVR